MDPKIEWQRIYKNKLRAVGVMRAEWAHGLKEQDLIPVQEWTERNNCGVRMSFDTWRFRDDTEITMFLLKWG